MSNCYEEMNNYKEEVTVWDLEFKLEA